MLPILHRATLQCLFHTLYAVPVCSTDIVPMCEIQSPVMLRLKVVNVVSFGVGSSGKDAHATGDKQMKPIRKPVSAVTCTS